MPTGYACEVSTRFQLDRVDIAAFWSTPHRLNHQLVLVPDRTAVILCVLNREECRAVGANPDELYQELAACRAKLPELEAQIRREEPELRDDHVLFEEYADWDYVHSQNPDYQGARLHCEELEGQLYHGTRLERIARNAVADDLYLAVPQGAMLADEVMPGWGVLSVPPNSSEALVLERSPKPQNCTPENRAHLIQNIAAAATEYVNAGHGLFKN